MAFGTLEDLEGAFDLVVFPDPYSRHRELLKRSHEQAGTGQPVPLLVSGTLETADPPKILVREAFELDQAEEHLAAQVHISVLASEATRDRLEALERHLYAGDKRACQTFVAPTQSCWHKTVGGAFLDPASSDPRSARATAAGRSPAAKTLSRTPSGASSSTTAWPAIPSSRVRWRRRTACPSRPATGVSWARRRVSRRKSLPRRL